MDKVSYALGLSMAQNLKGAGFEELDTIKFGKAIGDVFNGRPMEMTAEEAQQVLNEYFGRKQQEAAERNLQEGQAFLEKNKKEEGVVTLPSGLQYQILTEGNGPKPGSEDQVKCHYHGTLLDGTIFDSSVQRGTPATFGVNQVIKGWVEALQLMPVGSKWKLFIPADLAYGPHGAGQQIGPNTTLIFEVELLEIVK